MSDSKLSHKLILRKFIFLLLHWLTASIDCTHEPRTALAIKQDFEEQGYYIFSRADTFKELANLSTVFIDKSLLIKEFLTNDYNSTLIFSPNKWGKSMNLDMIHSFLQKQLDADGNEILPREETFNYRLFAKGEIVQDNGAVMKLQKPLLIADDRTIMDQFQGQYPVIRVTFKDVIGNNFVIIELKMRKEMARVFNCHKYVIKALERKKFYELANDFRHYCSERNLKNITQSLFFLSHLLHQHYQKKVFILIDDYDAPLKSFFQSYQYPIQDVNKTFQLLNTFMTQSLQLNIHLYKAMVIGTFKLHQNFFNGWQNKRECRIATQALPIREYFGFSGKLVDLLFQKFELPRKVSNQARKWYNGYVSAYSNDSFYIPQTISFFLNYKDIASYWVGKFYSKSILRKIAVRDFSPGIRNTFLNLFGNGKLRLQGPMELSPQAILNIKELQYIDTKGPWQVQIFFSYLLGEGYLADIPGSPYAKLTNYDIASVTSVWLLAAYQRMYTISDALLNENAVLLREFITNEVTTAKRLQDLLTDLYTENRALLRRVDRDKGKMYEESATSPESGTIDITAPTEDPAFDDTNPMWIENPQLTIFNCILLHMQCSTRFEYEVYYNGAKQADAVIVNDLIQQGAVININYFDYRHASEMVEEYKYIQLGTVQEIKYISINIEYNGTVDISAQLIKRTR